MSNDRLATWRTAFGVSTLGLCLAACTDATAPAGEPPNGLVPGFASDASRKDKGFIGGWLDGEAVALRYTKSYFCATPTASGAPSGCVVGAPPEIAARGGPIPPIYAVVPVGFTPDLDTLHCPAGVVCLNPPATLDFSRIGGPASAPGAQHSHIITSRQAGWHHTVNIRVTDPGVWAQIAAAKSLETVRQLQADPAVGGAGLISADTPTNIYFFFSVHNP